MHRALPSAQIQPNAATLIKKRFTLQMDNDPKQTATQGFLSGDILQSPSQSSDVNPIIAFRLLNTKLNAEGPTNKKQLKVSAEAKQSI